MDLSPATLPKQNTTSILGLCIDIMLHLFSFLDKRSLGRCAIVCRSWRAAAYYPSLWANCLLELPVTGLSQLAGLSLKDRSVSAVSIKQDWLRLVPTTWGSKYPYDHDSKIIELYREKFAKCEVQLTQLVRCCIESIGVDTIVIMDTPIQLSVGTRLCGVKCLGLIDLDIDQEQFISILSTMDSLDHLYINNKNRLASSEILFRKKDKRRFNCFQAFQAIIATKPRLRCLELVSIAWSIYFQNRNIFNFGESPKLQSLTMKDTMILTDDMLIQVAHKLPQLKHLHFLYSQSYLIMKQKATFPSLESLKVEIDSFTNFRSNYRCLFSSFTDSPNLVSLDLSNADKSIRTDIYRVKDKDMEALVTTLPNLKAINISENIAITEQGIVTLLSNMLLLEVLVALDIELVWTADTHGKQPAHLQSLLVEDNPLWLDQVEMLKYKLVCTETSKKVYRKALGVRKGSETSSWLIAQPGSHHWKQAFGASYFHSEFDDIFRAYNSPKSWLTLCDEKRKAQDSSSGSGYRHSAKRSALVHQVV